jgi:dTDP-4-dehydrorhamnose reductase
VRRALVIGGHGQLGIAIRDAFDMELVAPTRLEFDLVRDDIEQQLAAVEPDVLINCAAFHNVDQCEREPMPAFEANAIAVDRLAAACARRGVTFVTISTDYVFAGTGERPYRESDATEPRTSYGTSKLAGELLTRRHGPRHIIVRTSGVFGTRGTSSKGYTLIDKVLAQAERGDPTRMVDDMTFSPSFAPHVAVAIRALIEREAFGTHHVVNAGHCTWFQFVRTAFAKAGLTDAPLEAITYASLGNRTQRPMYSPMENTTFEGLGIAAMPSWETALDDYLAVRRARVTAGQLPATAQK